MAASLGWGGLRRGGDGANSLDRTELTESEERDCGDDRREVYLLHRFQI
jgi:hypothetical protein